MSQNNDRYLSDLPLQFVSQNIPAPQSKYMDLPRQLVNDLYRPSNKENCLKDEEVNLLDEIISQEDLHNFGDKTISCKKVVKKDDSHLRNIIKKKLFTANKDRQVQEVRANRRDVESRKNSKYQQLLSEFYGGPKEFSSKPKKAISSAQKQQSTLSRHQSAKTILPPHQQMLPTIQRNRSHSSLKCTKLIVPSSKQLPQSNKLTYLDLYIQKRRPVLYL